MNGNSSQTAKIIVPWRCFDTSEISDVMQMLMTHNSNNYVTERTEKASVKLPGPGVKAKKRKII